MDIRCERCGTEYELDDAQVPEAGANIKCSNCQNTFRVTRPVAAPPAVQPQVMVRLFRPTGASDVPCPDEGTLRVWIRENRVLRTDSISFDGTEWTPLGNVPELADAFPSAPPPMAPAPVVPPVVPPEKTPQLHPGAVLPSLSLPVDATVPDLPKLSIPPPPSTGGDSSRTVQVQMDPAALGGGKPAGIAGTDSVAALGKLNRPVEGAAPASAPGLVLPSFSMPAETGATLPPPPKSASKPAPSPRAPAVTRPPPVKNPTPAPVAPVGRPIDQLPTQPPRARPAPKMAPSPAPKEPKRPGEVTDSEIAAFKKQGQSGRVFAGLIVVALIGAAGWFGYGWWRKNHLPEAAKAPYEQGRTIYLADARAKFPDAEAAFQQALDLAGQAPYPDALGGLAELHVAWGEQLWNKAQPIVASIADKKKALVKTPDDKALQQEINKLGGEANGLLGQASDHFNKALDFAKQALHAGANANVPARRALLDYYRIKSDGDDGQKQEDDLKKLKADDPETAAHLAAFDALDMHQLAASEDALKQAIQADSDFVRGWTWLAQIHVREGNKPQAIKDLTEARKLAPDDEGVTELLAQLQPPAPAPVPSPVATTASDDKKTTDQPKEEDKKARDSGKSEEHSSEEHSSRPVNVDRLVKEGDHNFERRRYRKALAAYDKALEAKPRNVDANFGRGLALDEMHKYDQAIAAFKKTLDISPRFGDAMIALAELYKNRGQNQNAVRYYQMYLTYNPSGDQAAVARANVQALR